jgi:hypothetical protein
VEGSPKRGIESAIHLSSFLAIPFFPESRTQVVVVEVVEVVVVAVEEGEEVELEEDDVV